MSCRQQKCERIGEPQTALTAMTARAEIAEDMCKAYECEIDMAATANVEMRRERNELEAALNKISSLFLGKDEETTDEKLYQRAYDTLEGLRGRIAELERLA